MCKLGYVFTKRKINDLPNFIGVVSDLSKIDNPNLPVIVVGLENAKKYIENFSILEHKVNENLFWTFGKSEKREEYEKDINNFYSYCIKKSIHSLKYFYIDVIKLSIDKTKKLINLINSNQEKYIYIHGDMMYIYIDTYVLGISLSLCEYCGIKKDKIFKKIRKKHYVKITYSDVFLGNVLKSAIKNKKYAVAYFMSMEE